ncbi:hypothetical protein M0813_29111 [Anaeramoeba flamelloides]|uniref:Vacuolar protein sorting 55 n=1 Tax=Anaeramoeba flamelloides TaxID=1746091 RepID=A0AAV7Y7M7_9EUKA|nr:hypothetical protein M0812_29982 [Anaeramoeba flamelloides]KAJ6234521.1 hypothetical protein M0813_29111 [Anaeramoeba flamelloides]|eukprot:Anaeramoba_flamelloidesa853334_65.p1 GENE.a853334_65~~a853334_65.p1  ORF type:complete len:137 (+),score=19.64 a853334_65:29-412(+)
MQTKQIVLISAGLAIGFFLNIIACAVWENWLPFLVIIFYVLVPLPKLICSGGGESFDSAGGFGSDVMAFFFIGIFGISGFALTAVLVHVDKIEVAPMILSFIGTVIVGIFTIVFVKQLNKQDDHEAF